jgi:hypothetical protein
MLDESLLSVKQVLGIKTPAKRNNIVVQQSQRLAGPFENNKNNV